LEGAVPEALLLATAAQESHLGHYLHQEGGGPARGIYQIEPATYGWLLKEIRQRSAVLAHMVDELRPSLVPTTLEGSLHYATAICRLRYWIVPEALPGPTFEAIWRYYKKHWNSDLGAATRRQFLSNYRAFGLQKVLPSIFVTDQPPVIA